MNNSLNAWLVYCAPLDRADHVRRQADIPKAIAYFKERTGELPKYIAACPPSKEMDDLTVLEDIELIIETGLSGWELRLASTLPYPENRWDNHYLKNRGERGKAGQAEAVKISDDPPHGEKEAAAAPPNITETSQDAKKPTDKTVYPKVVPPSLTKLILNHLDASEKCLPHRHKKLGEVSLRTLYRRQAEIKRKQQPVMI